MNKVLVSSGSRGPAPPPPPPLVCRPNWGPKGRKKKFWRAPRPFTKGLVDRLPPPPPDPYLKVLILHCWWCWTDHYVCFSFVFKVTKLFIFFTDGKNTDQDEDLTPYSQQIKAKGIETISVGVGNGTDLNELRIIASSPNNVIQLDEFEELKYIIEKLVPAECKASEWRNGEGR